MDRVVLAVLDLIFFVRRQQQRMQPLEPVEVERETAAALQRAIIKAVHLINANKTKYLHHLIADVPPELGPLTPADFRLSRLRYVEPRPYPVDEFERTYAWMQSWGLVPEGATYESLVDNRVGV